MIIAVDFDGTIQKNDKTPNIQLIEYLRRSQRHGASIILWTSREGERLGDAIRFCNKHGLWFNAINRNMTESIKNLGYDSRKILADIYIDDKAVKVP